MLSKCANPECSTPFQYLRDGRLFLVEAENVQAPAVGPQLVGAKRPQSKVEHFWLCGACVKTMTLVVEPGKGVVTVPHASLPTMRRAAAG